MFQEDDKINKDYDHRQFFPVLSQENISIEIQRQKIIFTFIMIIILKIDYNLKKGKMIILRQCGSVYLKKQALRRFRILD